MVHTNHENNWQAKKETVDKVIAIVKEKLALASDIEVTAESEFTKLGADSLDTVTTSTLIYTQFYLFITKKVVFDLYRYLTLYFD